MKATGLKSPLKVFFYSILIIDLFYFSLSYFFGKTLPGVYLPYAFFIFFITAMIACLLKGRESIFSKLLLSVVYSTLAFISLYFFVFITMFLPGSREHNYVMYVVCIPELSRYYQSRGKSYSLSPEPHNKGWEEHQKCEDNVRHWRDPLYGIK